MSNASEAWGVLLFGGLVAVGGYWLLNHYEIRKKPTDEPTLEIHSIRPTGMLEITETKSGSVWRLNADSVRGDRNHRQGWIVVDASKDKTAKNWRYRHVLYLIDCDTTATRELSTIFYNANGESPWPSESVEPAHAKPEYYPEGTIGHAPVREMCSSAFDS